MTKVAKAKAWRSLRRSKNSEEAVTLQGELRKRKLSKHFEDADREKNQTKKIKIAHDKYCWICHKPGQERKCSTCVRVYHTACTHTPSTQFSLKGSCQQCQQEAASKEMFAKMKASELNSVLLRYVLEMDKKIDADSLFVQWPTESDERLSNIVDLRVMMDRCRCNSIEEDELRYHSVMELLGDIKWVYHNSVIIYGVSDAQTKSVRKIVQKCTEEIEDLLDCLQCYSRKLTEGPLAFRDICDKPHSLVWAKVKGFRFWPAKCLRTVKGLAHVRFFGTYQKGAVVAKNCLFLSKEYPDKKPEKNIENFMFAMQELEEHLSYFREKYGEFPYQPINKLYDPKLAEETMMEVLEKYEASFTEQIDLTEEEEDQFQEQDISEEYDDNSVEFSDIIFDESKEADNTVGTLSLATCNGALLPGIPITSSSMILPADQSSEAGISIQRVMSASDADNILLSYSQADFSALGNEEEQEPSENGSTEPVTTTSCLSESKAASFHDIQGSRLVPTDVTSTISSENDEDCVIVEPSESERTNEKKEKVIKQILRADPQSQQALKQAYKMSEDLFIKFWCTAGKPLNTTKQDKAVAQMKSTINKQQNEIVELEQELERRIASAKTVLEGVKKNLCAGFEVDKKVMQSEHEQYIKELMGKYEKLAAEREEKISVLTAEVDTLRGEMEPIRAELVQKTEENEKIAKEMDALKREMEGIAADLAAKTEENKNHAAEIDSYEREREWITAELVTKTEENKKSATEIDTCKREIDRLAAALVTKVEENANLQVEVEKLNERKRKLAVAKFNNLKEENKNLKEEMPHSAGPSVREHSVSSSNESLSSMDKKRIKPDKSNPKNAKEVVF